ncbi:DegV family protein [Deinococcus lacus]|uniref:DegV family protein n=1 Tax=Deinococcus lacus TaxID=392561 RepID=A0ABW1YCW7_9DEIO
MTASSQRFRVVTDGGMDAYSGLNNDVPVAPFNVNFGSETMPMHAISPAELYRRLEAGEHPTSSQPTPQAWADAFMEAGAGGLPVLAITISSGLSGSLNAAEQARSLVDVPVTLLDSRTLSTAQSFAVHAAVTASLRGESLETGEAWAKATLAEAEILFTIETLEYLRRGGRIGRVAAAMGGLLNLKPIITVEKPDGVYVNTARVRSYKGAVKELAAQLTQRFGEGTPLRLGLLHGTHPEDAQELRAHIAAHHPIVWEGVTHTNPVLNIHTGPRAAGVGAAPGNWIWEQAENGGMP